MPTQKDVWVEGYWRPRRVKCRGADCRLAVSERAQFCGPCLAKELQKLPKRKGSTMTPNEYRRLFATLTPMMLRDYALKQGWNPVEGAKNRIWVLGDPKHPLRQLIIPMDEEDPGFERAAEDVLRRLAEAEGRSPDEVLLDLCPNYAFKTLKHDATLAICQWLARVGTCEHVSEGRMATSSGWHCTRCGESFSREGKIYSKAPKTSVSLAFVVLQCAGLERARAFYTALGFKLTAEQHGDGLKHYSATLGSTVLELYPVQNKQTSGLRLGLRVGAPEAAVEAVRPLGAIVIRVSKDEAVVQDPDGHILHLLRST